ncbi:MAG: valine--tRNA ligase [Bacteroidales bacterium]|nr:valine--tRNA ligase [Bacteroidales bacterium]
MDIPSRYKPGSTESKWYKYWMEQGFFKSIPDEREPYVITIPPPNVTGVLHMGHMLNNTLQDVLIRRQRMMNRNACWVPGTDHASIATEARVVAKLKEEGIEKKDLTRDEFLSHAWTWTEKHGGIILEQLKRLGASCDWDRTLFTMDELRYKSVIRVFNDLYSKGLIYRGVRMVNWDPDAKTAVSDEEVMYKEEDSVLYYVRYRVSGTEDKFVTVATTRPETILGDTAVCVNPADERYKHLEGKSVIVPMVNREVPVIFDDYVDMEFGTGCLKITPAHDINDYEIGVRHGLEVIDIFNDDGTLSSEAVLFTGTDRFEARAKVVELLREQGLLELAEDYRNKIGRSERTDAVIEPKLSTQWFLKMEELAKPALDAVMNSEIKIFPSKFKNVYRHWMENVRDWCISRQLWWGHRIPAWYYGSGEFVVAENEDEALALARKASGNNGLTASDIRQDEDVLDTWFSSWLWPIAGFNGILEPDNRDINYYYPTNALITAPEILFFWVARMIVAGYEYRGEKPFNDVYLHGIVRDPDRRKMSKSLGNSPDPLKLIDKYGADGVRVGMLLCSPAGNDLLYDDSLPEQGRNFANKIWNAFRLVKGWETDDSISEQPEWSSEAVHWFSNRLNLAINEYNKAFDKYRISDALMIVYRLFWDDFSSWYLEAVKPDYQKAVDKETYRQTIAFFDRLVRLIHPFMPFITEEIWQMMEDRTAGSSVMVSDMPEAEKVNTAVLDDFEHASLLISAVRKLRKEKGLGNKDMLSLFVNKKTYSGTLSFRKLVERLGKVTGIEETESKPEASVSFMVGTSEYYVVMEGKIDVEEEIKKLEAELEYNRGFLKTVMKKLDNERFVNNAPAKVVDTEKKKKKDTELKIRSLIDRIGELKKVKSSS